MTDAAPPAGRIDRVVVVVPALDEARRIEDSLRSVATAAHTAGVDVVVMVVDDGSVDESASTARRVIAGERIEGKVTAGPRLGAGAARAHGIRVGLAGGAPARTWLMSTDADSVVPPTWITDHLRHASLGAVAVAGVVALTDDDDARGVAGAWWSEYGVTLAADLTHPHVHAANLGVRADAYLAVGGFAPVTRAEDIDLWRRLKGAGHVPVADSSIVVHTSARPVGRVAEGFAHAVDRLYRAG